MKVLLKLFVIIIFTHTIYAFELPTSSGKEQDVILEDFENLPALQDDTQEKQEYEEISYLDYSLNKKLPQVLLDIILAYVSNDEWKNENIYKPEISVYSISYLDNKQLTTIDGNNLITWDDESESIKKYDFSDLRLCYSCFSSKDQLIATSDCLYKSKIIKINPKTKTHEIITNVPNTVQQVVALPNNKCAYTYADCQQMIILDIDTKDKIIIDKIPILSKIIATHKILITTHGKTLALFDLNNLKLIKNIELDTPEYINCLNKLSNNVIAVGCSENTIFILNIKNGKFFSFSFNTPPTHEGFAREIVAIAKLKDNKIAAARHKTIKIFDLNQNPPNCIFIYEDRGLKFNLNTFNNKIIIGNGISIKKIFNERFNLESKIKILKKITKSRKRKLSK